MVAPANLCKLGLIPETLALKLIRQFISDNATIKDVIKTYNSLTSGREDYLSVEVFHRWVECGCHIETNE
jgi:hypothetical protein